MSFLIIEKNKWDGSISGQTFFILWLGLTTYLIGALLADRFVSRVKVKSLSCYSFKYKPSKDFIDSVPQISRLVTIFIILFDLVVLIKYYSDVRFSASLLGSFSDLATMIGLYRVAGVYGETKVDISRVSSYGYTVMTGLAYIYLYVLIANSMLRKMKITWKIFHMIPIVLFGICSLLTGGRNPILQLLIAGFMIFYLLNRNFKGKSRNFNLKFAIKLAISIVVVLILFSNMSSIVGRGTTLGTFDYIAIYIGAPIKLFDMFVQDHTSVSHVFWGQETFVNVWKWIGGVINNRNMTSLFMNKEFRTYNGLMLGNVYTAFREYYSDFGITGIVIFPLVHSVFFTTFYKKIIKSKKILKQNAFNLSILLYSYLSVALAYYSIDDRLFQKFFSIGTFREILCLVILANLLPRIKLGKAENQTRLKGKVAVVKY
jgi:oligosaccharide repeat unit polymerase